MTVRSFLIKKPETMRDLRGVMNYFHSMLLFCFCQAPVQHNAAPKQNNYQIRMKLKRCPDIYNEAQKRKTRISACLSFSQGDCISAASQQLLCMIKNTLDSSTSVTSYGRPIILPMASRSSGVCVVARKPSTQTITPSLVLL